MMRAHPDAALLSGLGKLWAATKRPRYKWDAVSSEPRMGKGGSGGASCRLGGGGSYTLHGVEWVEAGHTNIEESAETRGPAA